MDPDEWALKEEEAWREYQRKTGGKSAANVVRKPPPPISNSPRPTTSEKIKIKEHNPADTPVVRDKVDMGAMPATDTPAQPKKQSLFAKRKLGGSDTVFGQVQEKNFDSQAPVSAPVFRVQPCPPVQHRDQEPLGRAPVPVYGSQQVSAMASEISKENAKIVASMSKEQIKAEQQQLLELYGADIIEAFRKRTHQRTGQPTQPNPTETKSTESKPMEPKSSPKRFKKNPTVDQISSKLGRKPTEKELETMQWMKPITEIPENAMARIMVYRFDLDGRLLSRKESEELSVRAALHHHGDDPGLAGYTLKELIHLVHSSVPAQASLSLRALKGVILNLQNQIVVEDSAHIIRYLFDQKLGVIVRFILDSTRPASYLEAIETLHALTMDPGTEAVYQVLHRMPRGYELFGNFKGLENEDYEDDNQEDNDVILEDLVIGLLNTGINARLRFLMEVAGVTTHIGMIFDFLWRCVVHSSDGARHVYECPRLLSYIQEAFIFFTIPSEWLEEEQQRFKVAQLKALRLVKALCSASSVYASSLARDGTISQLLKFLQPLLKANLATDHVSLSQCTTCLHIIGTCWGYGLLFPLFFELFQFFQPHIVLSDQIQSISQLRVLEEIFGALYILVQHIQGLQHPDEAEAHRPIDWVQIAPLVEQTVQLLQHTPHVIEDASHEEAYESMISSALLFLSAYLEGVGCTEKGTVGNDQLQPLIAFLSSPLFANLQTAFLSEKLFLVDPQGSEKSITSDRLHLGFTMTNFPGLGIHNIHRNQYISPHLGHTDTWTTPTLQRTLVANKLLLSYLRTQKHIAQHSNQRIDCWDLLVDLMRQFNQSLKHVSQQTLKLPGLEPNVLFILRTCVHVHVEVLMLLIEDVGALDKPQTLCIQIVDNALALIPCLLPGDEVLVVEILHVLKKAYNFALESSKSFTFPVDLFTSTVLLSDGLKDSSFLVHFTQHPERSLSFHLPVKTSQLPLPFDWIFLLFHQQGQYPELTHVQQGLMILNDLEEQGSNYIQAIPVDNKMAHILHIFLLSPQIFLDPFVLKLIADLINLYAKKLNPSQDYSKEPAIALESAIGRQFFQFAQNFFEKYASDSYGCRVQGRSLQIFMQSALPQDVKRILWATIQDLWHLLLPVTPSESYVFLPLNSLLSPEKDTTVLKKYTNALTKSERLEIEFKELRCQFPYWFLVHHLASFIWDEKGDPSDRLFLFEELLTAPMDVVSDIFYYLCPESDNASEWIEKIQSTPPILRAERSQFIFTLAKTHPELQVFFENFPKEK